MSLGTDTPFTMPVVPASSTSGNGNGNGWGNDGSWWIIILFLFIFAGGWNRGGWGGNGNGGSTPSGSGAIDNYVLASDFAQVERKLDTVQQGLCDGFYATAQQINGVNTAILTNGNATQMAIMQGNNAVQAQLADCCCQTQRQVERGFADTNYNLATQSCDTRNTINMSTRDLLENANANNAGDSRQADFPGDGCEGCPNPGPEPADFRLAACRKPAGAEQLPCEHPAALPHPGLSDLQPLGQPGGLWFLRELRQLWLRLLNCANCLHLPALP